MKNKATGKTPLLALVDCDNFFVSCERLFRPDLEGKPVVVLSSNDGCAVARSNEAKSLGIPMGAPAFKYRQAFNRHKVVQLSANFELYGDISRRITELLTSITPLVEIYSIDESFLDLSQLPISDYVAWGKEVQRRIYKWIGVPVSIGLAPTKTLAKLATSIAKKDPELNGVLSFIDIGNDLKRHYCQLTPVVNVWGVGSRLGPRLHAEGIWTAEQLRELNPRRAQQLLGIHGRQMIAELNGTSCKPLELEGKLRQSISRTRTFGHDTSNSYEVEAALANFSSQASYRLRESGQKARRLSIFLTSNKHKPGYRHWGREEKFEVPTADTGQVAESAVKLFAQIYQTGVYYHRAGILLHDFVPADYLQSDLLGTVDVGSHLQSGQRMLALDSINGRYGRRTIRLAAEELGSHWEPRRGLRSPRYVSNWQELPKVQPI